MGMTFLKILDVCTQNFVEFHCICPTDAQYIAHLRQEYHNFEVRHPRCVSNKSNCKLYAYIVKHNYVLGGMLLTIRKAQLHVSATNFDHHQVVQ